MRALIPIAVLCLCACAPKKNTPIEEIPKLTKLDDVMDNQAAVADPLFKKIGTSSFSDAEWAQVAEAGARLQATSAKIKDFSKGAAFDALALRLNEKAKALADAATAKDAAAASSTLAEMKATCKECHSKFK
jgi:cytochrome c556